jgi:Ca2+-transporting ATPase
MIWSRGIFHALRSPNRAFWWVVGGAFGFLRAVIYLPALRNIFRFARCIQETCDRFAAATVSFLLIEIAETKRGQTVNRRR